MILRKLGGWVKGRLELFRKFIRFGGVTRPLWKVLMDEYFHYHGSLTTGTCDEAVNWMVFKVIVAIGQLFSQFHRISQFCCFLLTKYHQKHSRCQNFVHASWLICRLTLEVSFVIAIVTLFNFS